MVESRRQIWDRLFPGAPAYRFSQCEKALFTSNMKSWADVTALPKDVRETLVREMPWWSVRPLHIYKSKRGDTYKAVLVGADDKPFETVLMENARDQWTICVSSQIGCAMRCTFCATGKMGLKRSLLADEIVDQMRFWRKFLADKPSLPQRISNVVFMGMGEPLANYDNVVNAMSIMLDDHAYGLSRRRVTLSTSGLVPALDRLREDCPVALAVSLHAPNDTLRDELVPINQKYPLRTLLAACERYLEKAPRDFVTFEYVMLDGVNDRPHHAQELIALVRDLPCKFNLIPFNPFPHSGYARSSNNSIRAFREILQAAGFVVTVRKTRGDDIDAACGQLAGKVQDKTRRTIQWQDRPTTDA